MSSKKKKRKRYFSAIWKYNKRNSLLKIPQPLLREGNGTPLQYSCLDGGVWWAAVYGVAQSRTRLK